MNLTYIKIAEKILYIIVFAFFPVVGFFTVYFARKHKEKIKNKS
jgi:hypothetical protein